MNKLIPMQRSNCIEWDEKTIMNNEEARIWKQAVVTYFKVPSQHWAA
jgi:hypothetical protein